MNKGGRFLKKLWCCVGGEYYKICSDKGLMLEMSAFESLYGGQFTLSTQLIKPNYPLNSPGLSLGWDHSVECAHCQKLVTLTIPLSTQVLSRMDIAAIELNCG